MKLPDKPVSLSGPRGTLTIERNSFGIPEITGDTWEDAAFGQGWAHARDRQLQVLLTRTIVRGRAAEKIAADPALVELDLFMRKMNFLPDPERMLKGLRPEVRELIAAYVEGFNRYLASTKPPWEFRLIGYEPEPLAITDVLIMVKVMGFLGLADVQGNMERFIIEMIRNDVSEEKLHDLFPSLTEKIDYDLVKKVKLEAPLIPGALRWLGKLPRFTGSNNWVLSGKHTESGKPYLCNDPHLEINRIPPLWYESVLRVPDNYCMGAGLPGVPGIVIGRTRHLSWGITFAFVDTIDFRIEECRDGKYRRGKGWRKFQEREETVRIKKREPLVRTFYENELGTLEGDPRIEGHYLVMCWAGASGCGEGDFNGQMGLMRARTVKEGMSLLEQVDVGAWNFVLADREGNIGYRMTGRAFDRPRRVSGIVPTPAWEKKYDSSGFIKKRKYPALYNPKEGYIATANQDLNDLGKARVITIPSTPWRALRILDLLAGRKKFGIEDMKRMQYDLHSLQAEAYMRIIRPLLPDTRNGNILMEWDCRYTADSRGATLFESVYRALVMTVFGDNGIGREVMRYLIAETILFSDYYNLFDAVLLREQSPWFEGRVRDDIYRQAIEEGIRITARPWGKTQRIVLSHILFGGRLPRLAGFDRGPVHLPGGRTTILQGQAFRNAGRLSSFSASYRLVTDMATDQIQSNLPGGVSERRFSPLYQNDLANWAAGVYKVLGASAEFPAEKAKR